MTLDFNFKITKYNKLNPWLRGDFTSCHSRKTQNW